MCQCADHPCLSLQLLFMKRGGELIYAGPLGPRSCELIKYFEVRLNIFIPLNIYDVACLCYISNLNLAVSIHMLYTIVL